MLVSDKSLILTSDSITFTFAASRSILMLSVIKASGVTGIVVFLGLCCLGGGLLEAVVNGITGAGNTGGAAVGAASGGAAGENAFADGLREEIVCGAADDGAGVATAGPARLTRGKSGDSEEEDVGIVWSLEMTGSWLLQSVRGITLLWTSSSTLSL